MALIKARLLFCNFVVNKVVTLHYKQGCICWSFNHIVKTKIKTHNTHFVTVDASMVRWTSFTAEVGIVIAVHCWHRAAESCSVAERTWPAARCRRLVGALCTSAAALLALMIHWTVEVSVRRTPWRSVTVFTAYIYNKHLSRLLSTIIWEIKQRGGMHPSSPSLYCCPVPKPHEAARGMFIVRDCRRWRRVNRHPWNLVRTCVAVDKMSLSTFFAVDKVEIDFL